MKQIGHIANLLLAVFITDLAYIFFHLSPEYLIIVFVLSVPIQIKDQVFSLFGGINEDGNVYSLVPIFQIARHNSYSLVNLSIFQYSEVCTKYYIGCPLIQAGGGDIIYKYGLSFFQTGNIITYDFGVSVYQKAEGNIIGIVSLTFFQKTNHWADIHTGLVLVQMAKRYECTAMIKYGIIVWQQAYTTKFGYGLCLFQKGSATICLAGLQILQQAKFFAVTGYGYVLFQKAQRTERNIEKANWL